MKALKTTLSILWEVSRMSKLIRAGIRRYIRSSIFWLAAALTAALAVWSGYDTRQNQLDDFGIMTELFLFAVMLTWLVGREYDEGIFRNKVIAGYTKGTVYLSELLLGSGFCILLFLLYAVIFFAFNSYAFSVLPAGVWICSFLDFLLVNIAFAVIFVTVSCLIPHRAITGIVNLLLVFAIAHAVYNAEDVANQDEYYIEYDYEYETKTDEYGRPYKEVIPMEGSERKVKNPEYIGGWRRTFCRTVYHVLPYGHLTEYVYYSNVCDCFGYNYSIRYLTTGTYEAAAGYCLTKEDEREIYINLIYSVGLLAVLILGGYLSFRKKELK